MDTALISFNGSFVCVYYDYARVSYLLYHRRGVIVIFPVLDPIILFAIL